MTACSSSDLLTTLVKPANTPAPTPKGRQKGENEENVDCLDRPSLLLFCEPCFRREESSLDWMLANDSVVKDRDERRMITEPQLSAVPKEHLTLARSTETVDNALPRTRCMSIDEVDVDAKLFFSHYNTE